nr:MAG TPA: DNA packaging protein gp3 [Caudoviricetes sp.]
MAKKQIVIDAPKKPVVRYILKDERHLELDLRGIRNPHNPFNGRLNPSKGMKRKFLSPEHLQCMVNEYFESCNGPLIDKWGQLVYDKQGNLVKVQVKPYTVSGLSLYLGISTDTFRKYKSGKIDDILDEMSADTDDKLTFSKVMTNAKRTVEAYAESRLYDKDGQRGAQFVLDCQFNWVGHKEQADIKKAKADAQLRRDEFEFKRRLIDEGNEDDNLTINIVRGRRDIDETS